MRNRHITINRMNRMNRLFTMFARAASPAAVALAVALLVAGGAGTAEAQIFNWNGSSNTVITNTANWNSGSAPTFGGTLVGRIDALNGTNNTMTYTAAQGSTTISPLSARALVIGNGTNGSMLITGGTLTLNSFTPNLIGANSVNGTLTINGGAFLAGAQPLQFGINSTPGTATLTLTSGSANVPSLAFSQTAAAARAVVNLDGGTFVLGTTGTTGVSGSATFNFNGGTLQSSTATTNFLGGFTTANVGTGGARINAANDITITQGLLGSAGDGGLTKSGESALTLSGSLANTYSGVTTASAGQLVLNKTAGVNAVAGNLAITGGRVSFGANNQIADTSAVTMSGSASVFNGTGWNAGTLASLTETIGSVAVTGGVFQTGGGAVITVTGAGTFDGSTTYAEYLQNSGATISFGSLSLIGMTGTTAIGTARTGFAVAGSGLTQLAVGAGGLSLDGSNLLLQAANATTAYARLILGGDVTTAGSGASSIMTPSGQAGIGRVELSGTAGTVSRTFTTAGGGADLRIALPITDGSATTAGIVKAGAGTLILSGSSSYTGGSTVSAGTLRVGNASGLGASTGALAVNGGTLDLFGNSVAIGLLSGSSGAVITSGTAGSVTLTASSASDSTYAGAIQNGSGTFGFTKGGAGALTLSASNAYTGNTRVNGGTLVLSNAAAAGTGTVVLAGGTLSPTVTGLTTAGLSVAAGDSGVLMPTQASGVSTGTMSVDGGLTLRRSTGGTEGSWTTSALVGSGTLVVENTNGGVAPNGTNGRVILPSTSTFTGSVVVQDGGYLITNWTTVNLAAATVNAGGLLAARDGSTTTLTSLSGAGTIIRNGGTGPISLVVGGGTFSGSILQTSFADGAYNPGLGAMSLTKTSANTLVLSGSNVYAGTTTIAQGTLALGAGGSFANSSSIIVGNAGSAGAVLDLTAKTGSFDIGAGQTLGGGGTVQLAAAGTLNVLGLLSPGNSPGLLTFDAGTTLLSGTTLMEISGLTRATDPSHGTGFYDAINVVDSGVLTFGGLLQLAFSQEFGDNSTFNLFSTSNGGSLAGNFSDVSVTGSFYNGLTWSQSGTKWTSSNTTGGQSLEFNAATGALVIVPEPGALALAGIGVAAAAWAARRRRQDVQTGKR